MLKALVGDVNLYSAAVLVAMSVGLAAISIAFFVTHTPKRKMEMDHERDMANLSSTDRQRMTEIEAKWTTERKRIESGMITSHRSTGGDDI